MISAIHFWSALADRHSPSERGDASARLDHWLPLFQTDMNPLIDVEHISMMQMQLDNGVFAAYQQWQFTPDYWRNYTIIGTEGRIENVGNTEPGTAIKVWSTCRWEHGEADATFPIEADTGAHGGADALLMAEFLRFVRWIQSYPDDLLTGYTEPTMLSV